MAKNLKKNTTPPKGLMLYNLLIKEVAIANSKIKGAQKLTIQAKRELVSKTLYPLAKAQSKFSIRAIRRDVKAVVNTKIAPEEICNPLFLSESYLTNIEYYSIDEHIKTVLPSCIDVRVNAGSLGKTKIFNTENYSYYTSGVQKLIEKIREYLDDNSSGVAYFNGVIKLKYKKKNDGNPQNYFVEYVLYIDDEPVVDDTPIEFTLTKKEVTKKEKVKSYLSQQFKELQREKKRKKRGEKKAKPKTAEEQKKMLSDSVRTALQSFKTLLKIGAITQEEFDKQKQRLTTLKKNKP